MFNILLIIVIVICLGIIGFIVFRKLPKIRTLDVSTVPEAKSEETKNKILFDRMKRKTDKSKAIFGNVFLGLFRAIGNIFRNLISKIYALEKKYQREAKGISKKNLTRLEKEKKVKVLIDEADKLLSSDMFNEAETKYIQAISFDPTCIKAYKKLGRLYIENKEYKQALQTILYLVKLEHKNSQAVEKVNLFGEKIQTVSNLQELGDAYMLLANVYKMLEKFDQALENYKKAIEYQPNNPKILDETLDLTIQMKNKSFAFDLVKQLEKVNPENKKIKEYQEKISLI